MGDSTTSPRKQEKDFDLIEKAMPDFVYQSVLRDNQRYMFERNLYSPEFFSFLVDIMKSADGSGIDLSLPGSDFAIDIVAHAFHNKTLPDLVKIVLGLFEKFPESCENFIFKLINDNLQII